MLLMVLVLLVGLLLYLNRSRWKFLNLPGAGLQLPLIGHYQVRLVSHWSQTGLLSSDWSLSGETCMSHWSQSGLLGSDWSLSGQTCVSHWSQTGLLGSDWSLSCQTCISFVNKEVWLASNWSELLVIRHY